MSHFAVRYTGQQSHAAAAPERGINAGDAFTVAQVAIGLLRQHLPAGDQVHGVVRHGGDVANIIPAHADGLWMARARTDVELAQLVPRVHRCFEAGALATGAALEIEPVAPDYTQMEHDAELVEVYRRNAHELGRPDPVDAAMTFSTDMGNISLAMPSIHPCIGIESDGAVNHQPAFAAACINASADRAVLEGSLAMAWSAIEIATGPLRDRLLSAAP